MFYPFSRKRVSWFFLCVVMTGLVWSQVLGREISLFAATERREERREQLSSGAVETGWSS